MESIGCDGCSQNGNCPFAGDLEKCEKPSEEEIKVAKEEANEAKEEKPSDEELNEAKAEAEEAKEELKETEISEETETSENSEEIKDDEKVEADATPSAEDGKEEDVNA